LVSLTKDWEAPTKQPYNEQVTGQSCFLSFHYCGAIEM